MEYKKNMIILTGERGKCAVTVETASGGALCKLGVKSGDGERLYLAIKDKPKKYVGLVENVVKLPFEPSRNAHYAVISSKGMNVVLYGTLATEKLWAANMIDGVINEVEIMEEKFAASDAPSIVAQIETEKMRTEFEYDDEAIAQTDYYSREYRRMNTVFADYNINKSNTVGDKLRNYLVGYNAKLKGIETIKTNIAASKIFSLQRKYILEKETLGKASIREEFVCRKPLNECFVFFGNEKAGAFNREDQKIFNVGIKEKAVDANKSASSRAVRIESGKSKNVSFSKNGIKVPVVNADFYERIKPKLDKLFERGEHFEKLEREMPLTKWVKIPYEKNGYYVVGIIGDNPDYICYGVPGTYSPIPPEELGRNCKWLPDDVSRPQERGLWLLYQDAATGKSVQNPQ